MKNVIERRIIIIRNRFCYIFKTIENADLSVKSAVVHKAFSSVVTRYFSFREKHPEITDEEHKILYFKLKLDLIATYFSEYPALIADCSALPLIRYSSANIFCLWLNIISPHFSYKIKKDTLRCPFLMNNESA